jgi:hypothetical protein
MGRSSECDRLWEVDAYREGRLGEQDAASFDRHVRACAECRGRLTRDDRLQRLYRELGAVDREAPSPLALRRLRMQVLRDVAAGASSPHDVPRRRVQRAAAGGVLLIAVAATALVVGVHRSGTRRGEAAAGSASAVATTVGDGASAAGLPVEPYAGTVSELGGARWTQTREAGVERVTLLTGAVRVHVRPQLSGERFLVALPDGEIEVRGTTFDVTVAAGATTRVHVDEGTVELRLGGHEEMRVAAGETWTVAPPRQIASNAVAARSQPASSVTASAAPTPLPAPVDEGESAYAAAVALLRDGRNAEAAAAFQAFLIARPQAPQAEDASYLEAVALARAGRADAAALAAAQHLARFPNSFHRREAEALVQGAAPKTQ